ncbi:MAG: WD40 repeat domain-containing protein [Pseudonocardiaceae bacterium]
MESVELVHEALISRWSRLSEWFSANLAFRTWQEQLRGSLIQWETVQHNEGALLRGTPLAEAERWLTERPDDLGTPEQQFIHASRALRTRSMRRLRMVAAVLALLVLAASSLGGVALWQRNQAKEESRQIQSRELVTQANLLASYQPDVAMLLAATAYRIAPTREAVSALTSMASKWRHVDRLLATDMTGESRITFSPTDPTLVALTNANRIETWDLKKNIHRSKRDVDGVSTPTFSRDGRIIAYTQNAKQGNELVLWSYTEDRVREIPLNLTPENYAGNLAFSSDGKLLGACVGRRIQLWSLDTALPYRSVPLTHDDTPCAFGFRNENRELAYTDGDDIITWDIASSRILTMDQPGPPKRRQSSPLSSKKNQFFFGDDSTFTVAPDGRFAIYQGEIYRGDNEGYSHNTEWWDFDRRQAQEIEYSGEFLNPSFTPDGHRVALHNYGSLAIFDVAKRTLLAAYPVMNGSTISGSASAFSPDGYASAVLDTDTPNVISLTGTDLYHRIPVSAILVAIQPDKKHLTAVSSGGKVAIYSIKNGNLEPIVVRSSADDQSNEKRVESLSLNGLYYAFTDNRTQKVRLLDISSPSTPEVPLEGNHSDVRQLSFDSHSEFLACADKSEIIVWSTKTHTKKPSIPLPSDYTTTELKGLAISPGGRYVAATSSSGETRLWDTHSNDRTGTTIPFGDAKTINFSPDGTRLSIGGQAEIKLWILGANKFDPRRIPAGGALVKFSPDGSRLATREPESDRISVWKLNSRDPLLEGTVTQGADFAFTFDNSRIVVNEENVFVEPFDASWALEHVCHIVKRNLTPAEQDKYLSGFDHVQACPS